ncbi:MAG: hypothetical protein HBSAPP02_13760 [Phycisphaerae bacterium]|nr:MAG: hypothetical protein HRU71_07945 [Planctomycetia bacterium]RIK70660.1 MAG: hypothetical protein DCC66_05110 [Planctomycetota bacterium]GJQ26344.1 MAG: hypothetical protein HBSAPP02_13760 [Phycisphaerae bacterium]
MSTVWKQFSRGAVLSVAAMMAWGCSNSSSEPAAHKQAAEPAAPTKPEPAQVAAATHTEPAPAETKKPQVHPTRLEPITPSQSQTTAAQEPVLATTDEEKREQAANMIYAQIRLRMEEFISERKKLLSEGKTRDDARVQQLEGSILKARELLMEAGEMVEDVDPPIAPRN